MSPHWGAFPHNVCSRMRKLKTVAVLTFGFALSAHSQDAVQSVMFFPQPESAARPQITQDQRVIAESHRVSLTALTEAEIKTRRERFPTAVGQNRPVPANIGGRWIPSAGGKLVWSLAFHVPSAAGLRLHFTSFDAGQGQVWIHDGDTAQVFGPYTGQGAWEDGEFWTELITGSAIWVTFAPAPGWSGEAVPFQIQEVFELWSQPKALNLGCFLDVTCYSGNTTVGDFSQGTAFLVFSNYTCSGSLINDRNSTKTPYLLTAGHCVEDEANARSMLAVFGYKTSVCNGQPGLFGLYPQVSGSTLLARSLHGASGSRIITDQPDYAFVRLSALPNTAAKLMGWKTNPSSTERLTSVSHPRQMPQRLAAGNIVSSSDPNFYVVNMFQGAVDHGSSGSGLVTDGGQLVGVDSYGSTIDDVSACDVNDRHAGYTRFSAIYPVISRWLEAAAPPAVASISPVALNFGAQQIGTRSGNQSVTVSNIGAGTMWLSGVTIQGANSADFQQTNTCGASLAANASCRIDVSFRPAAAGAKVALLQIATSSEGGPHSVTLSGIGASARPAPTILNKVTSTVNGIETGICRVPPAVSNFSTSSPAVWFFFDVTGVLTSDTFRLAYYRPDGTLYTTFNASSRFEGYVCYSYFITVAGASAASFPGQWTIRIFWGDSSTPMSSVNFTLAPPSLLPVIRPGGVVNSASLADGLTPGGFLTIFGTNLSTQAAQTWNFTGSRLPTTTGGTQVLVNGKPAYVSYSSSTQINAIMPADTIIGPVSVQVVTAAGASSPALVTTKRASPAAFLLDQGGRRYAIATYADGSLVAPNGLLSATVRSRPARSGEVISLWMTALGPTNPAYPDGQVVTPLNRGIVALSYSITIGGRSPQIEWAGLVGPGLYQINVRVPQLSPGDALLQMAVENSPSPAGVYIAIGQ